ncbi:50S ribosomal protein L24 [Sulfuriflexus mobilis]|uniref:50S ribosomal protein L24 n=1 Tax=Sulfuriflexus mobilis TaxID=1811807 RepID=UPI000F84D95B|nr:50S ribosomal protein L24 [Sulfuriflexus mobilis]
MNRIKKGDEVIVLTGKDKGRRGNVIRVMEDNRVLVENINMAKRHTKANPQAGIAGGIIEKEMPLHASNVGLYNPATGKADRIGFKVLDDGRKVRYFKSNNEVVDA